MKIIFYAPDGVGDKLLVAAVMGGAARHGDDVRFVVLSEYRGVIAEADVAACYGVRASSRIILDAYRRAGKRTLFFDKGYWGRGNYTRVAIDDWHPRFDWLREGARERLVASGLELCAPRALADRNVIYAATTQTWCDFYDLGPARALDEIIVQLLSRQYPSRVVYRPRPAYAVKHPELCTAIAGAMLSNPATPLTLALEDCDLLVTLGSNAAVEARAAGVETCVLGEHPLRWLNGRRNAADVENLFAQLAYWQWTLEEYLSGDAWACIRRHLTVWSRR